MNTLKVFVSRSTPQFLEEAKIRHFHFEEGYQLKVLGLCHEILGNLIEDL